MKDEGGRMNTGKTKKKLLRKDLEKAIARIVDPKIGVPAANPVPEVMLEIHQPIYDTEWLAPGFLFKQELTFFQRPVGQRNILGHVKNFADTNMVQCSQLGVPQSFKASFFGIEILGDAHEDDKRRVLQRGVFCFSMGEGRAWVRTPLSVAAKGGALLPEKISKIEHGVVFSATTSWPCSFVSGARDAAPQRSEDERSVEFMIRGFVGVRVLMFGDLSVPA